MRARLRTTSQTLSIGTLAASCIFFVGLLSMDYVEEIQLFSQIEKEIYSLLCLAMAAQAYVSFYALSKGQQYSGVQTLAIGFVASLVSYVACAVGLLYLAKPMELSIKLSVVAYVINSIVFGYVAFKSLRNYVQSKQQVAIQ